MGATQRRPIFLPCELTLPWPGHSCGVPHVTCSSQNLLKGFDIKTWHFQKDFHFFGLQGVLADVCGLAMLHGCAGIQVLACRPEGSQIESTGTHVIDIGWALWGTSCDLLKPSLFERECNKGIVLLEGQTFSSVDKLRPAASRDLNF